MTAGVGEQDSDEELAVRFRRDPDGFGAVYYRYFGAVYRYVAGRLDVQVGEDVTAETFFVAFRERDRFDPARGSLRAWLFGIATNLVARHRRKEARHFKALARVGTLPVVDGPENRVVTSMAARRMKPQLAGALAALPKGERDVVLLVALSGLSHEEIAQALGISYGTVGSRLSRARKKLNDTLNQEDLDG